jgi:thermitase
VVRVRGDAADAARSFERSGAVDYAEPDFLVHALAIPNDPRFGQQWALEAPDGGDIDAPAGWDAGGLSAFPSTGGVKVGIVDTGIDDNHEDLAGRTADCASVGFGLLGLGLVGTDPNPTTARGCADDNDHGSHVAGTVAANTNNGVGVAGVAFNSSLAMCKALNSVGTGSVSGVANCITWLASRGARVISMSLGGGASSTLAAAVRSAYADGRGALLVAAAGNDGNSSLSYPASYPEVVSVAATDRGDRHASFSNSNAQVEVAAPGVDILSVKRGGGYVALSGTSMATPHVAGVAALVRWLHPTWTAAQVRARVDSAVDDLGPPGRDPDFGFGRVDLALALR